MRNAQAEIEVHAVEIGEDSIIAELSNLRRNLPLEKYFTVIEEFVDNARETISRVPDPVKRENLRAHYARVVEVAVELACKPTI